MLINIETGKKFAVFSHVPKGNRKAFSPVIKASYREIFRDAKKDLLTTAIRIGKRKKGSQIEHKTTPPKKVSTSVQMTEKPPVASKEPRTLTRQTPAYTEDNCTYECIFTELSLSWLELPS